MHPQHPLPRSYAKLATLQVSMHVLARVKQSSSWETLQSPCRIKLNAVEPEL